MKYISKVIALVPARCGSKSIPLKNIKLFCGKPLIYWNLLSLQNAQEVQEVYVATDCDQIADTVISFRFSKVKIYHRKEDNANDTASTESVMLEFLEANFFSAETKMILVQVTSPFTQAHHFSEAITHLNTNNLDSLLSCIRNKRFYWNEDGTSKNYDIAKRPRRQDFEGQLMENGAFYINSVNNILRDKNRLSGKTGIYEMPEYTGLEIDEPDDWWIAEKLMYKYVLEKCIAKKIKLFAMDVDGVLTDAGMYYSSDGSELKKFNTHDGKGIELIRKRGIKTAILTSEDTEIVNNRSIKLQIDYTFQGLKTNKLQKLQEICNTENISFSEVAYVGDDINCLELLQNVGFPACPSNSVAEISNIMGIYRLTKRGGDGAIREWVEFLIQKGIV